MNSHLPRREALKQMATAWVASSVYLAAKACSADPITTPKSRWKSAIGLNGFMSSARKYKKNYPIWEILDFASRRGFEGVELVDNWPSGSYPAAADQDRVRALRGLYDRYGLQIFSMQLGAGGASDPDEQVRRKWLAGFRDRVRLAQQLGCAHVGLWPGGGLKGRPLEQAVDCLGRTFHQAGKIAAEYGIVACFEIEPVFAFKTAQNYQRILEVADHPNLKGIYDPSHFDQMNGRTCKPEELLERIGVKNIGYVQFCDTDGTCRDGGTSTHLGCGDGRTDCAKGLRVLKNGGFRGWIMVDAWEVPDPYDACIKCKAVIDQVGREA